LIRRIIQVNVRCQRQYGEAVALENQSTEGVLVNVEAVALENQSTEGVLVNVEAVALENQSTESGCKWVIRCNQ
jgi:hypothetical protein